MKEYLFANHEPLFSEILILPERYEDMIHWDNVMVATMIELHIHELHDILGKHANGQVWCTNYEALLQRDDGVLGSTPLIIADNTESVLVTAYQDHHHYVLMVELMEKKIIYADGMDSAINHALTVGAGHRDLIKLSPLGTTSAEARIMAYAALVLDALNLHACNKSGKQIPIQFIRECRELRHNGSSPGLSDPWQLTSLVLDTPFWEGILIRQSNMHACGAVTVLQTIDLIGHTLLSEQEQSKPDKMNYAQKRVGLVWNCV
jgi:hypothetical protein